MQMVFVCVHVAVLNVHTQKRDLNGARRESEPNAGIPFPRIQTDTSR